jgi:hypothetical protein
MTRAAPVTNAELARQLRALESSLPPTRLSPRPDRKRVANRARTVPDSLVEQMVALAELNGGRVGLAPVDVASVRARMEEVKAAREAAETCRRLVAHFLASASNVRVSVSDEVFSVYTAMRRIVRMPEGNRLAPAYQQMQETLRKERPIKKKSRKKAP